MGLAASKQEAFWEACGFGHVKRVRAFIEQGIDVNWVSYTHNSCAIHVASQGKKEIVQMLIDAKCKINVKDDRGNLALHHAAMKGHADIMQMLIDAGSEIDTQDKNGWSPLINAAYFCQPEAAETLVRNNCDVNLLNKDERTALHEACRSQSTDNNGLAIIVCHLVEAGCDINAKSSDHGEADFTPIMFASYHGHAEVAEVLSEASCDINSQGSNGWSALHWAADRGNLEVVEVLLRWNIDPLLEGRRGELAVDRAQEIKLKNILQEATLKAKAERVDNDGFVCHSPVSTTSPASSRCSSVASLPRDETESQSGPDSGNSKQQKAGENPVESPSANADVLNGNTSKGISERQADDSKAIDSCPAESEGELRKEIPAEKTDISDPEINSKESPKMETPAVVDSHTTVDESQCSSTKSDSECATACEDISSGAINAGKSETETPEENPTETDTPVTEEPSSPQKDVPNSPSKSSDQEQPSQSSDLDSNSISQEESPNIAESKPAVSDDSKETDESDFSHGSPVKINPQMKRLLAPSGVSDGASDTDDGNVSDALFNDKDYCADLADCDGDLI